MPLGATLFRYKRLLFGVNSAPEIFQRVLEGLLAGCQNCVNYLDDIIVYAASETEHDLYLKNVKYVLHKNNILLNDEKCMLKVQ